MENSKLEEKEIYEVDNKKYTVITRISENCLSKESLKKLICNYAMRELFVDGIIYTCSIVFQYKQLYEVEAY